MSKTIRQYTVLLAYPNYIANDWCETYLGLVKATSVAHAITLAQVECGEGLESLNAYEDLAVVAVFKGHRFDIKECKE